MAGHVGDEKTLAQVTQQGQAPFQHPEPATGVVAAQTAEDASAGGRPFNHQACVSALQDFQETVGKGADPEKAYIALTEKLTQAGFFEPGRELNMKDPVTAAWVQAYEATQGAQAGAGARGVSQGDGRALQGPAASLASGQQPVGAGANAVNGPSAAAPAAYGSRQAIAAACA